MAAGWWLGVGSHKAREVPIVASPTNSAVCLPYFEHPAVSVLEGCTAAGYAIYLYLAIAA